MLPLSYRSLPVVLALGALGCGNDERLEPAEPRPLTVMTFNVLCSLCNLSEYDPWSERLEYFGDIFARHDPDLMGIQELTPLPGEVDQLLEQAPDHGALWYAPEDRPAYPDAMILYRKSRFEVLEHDDYWLSPTPDVPSSSGFAQPQLARLVYWARLFDHGSDRELFFASTHFDNNSPSQELSAPLVLGRTAPWAEQMPVIFVGDFNSRPESKAYATLTTDTTHGVVFLDSFDAAAEWRVTTNQTPVPDYDTATRIDHVFLAGSAASWPVASWTPDLTVYGAKARYPSDHFPIVATLEPSGPEP